MHTHQHSDSPLKHPTFEHVSRHLSLAEIVTIMESRTLSPEWKDETRLTLAHRLYWAERDWELAVSSALHEVRLTQMQSWFAELNAEYLHAVHQFD